MRDPVVLSVDASDPLGEEGAQADQRTVEGLGGRCVSVLTALLSGGGKQARALHDLPVTVVKDQLDSVLALTRPAASRVGLLPSVPVIRAVARALGSLSAPVVLEPVAVLRAGPPLLGRSCLDALRRELLPRAAVVLLGPLECGLLASREVACEADAKAAARALQEAGAATVVLRSIPAARGIPGPGGFLDGRTWYRFPDRPASAAGLSTGAAIAFYLATGDVAPDAVERGVRHAGCRAPAPTRDDQAAAPPGR